MEYMENCVVVPDIWVQFNQALDKIEDKDYEKLTDLFLEKEKNIFSEEFFEIVDKIIQNIDALKDLPKEQARAFVLAASLFSIFDGHLMYFFVKTIGDNCARSALAVVTNTEEKTRH